MNIPTLIQEAKQGSAAAQKYLFESFADKMLPVCCRYVKSREDAEELILEEKNVLILNRYFILIISLKELHPD